MSGRKRKKISRPFSSSKKPKRWKSDGTEEFSVERALHDRGSYYNQDEFAFCPSVFQLFAGSEHSQPHRVRLLARMLVPPQDFPFLASWGMVIKHIWRSKRCKVEHNTNSADKIFCVKEIAAVHIQTFSKLLVFCPSNDNTATEFCARIVDICLFQVVISHCCGKLNHADICQCGGDFNT